MTNTHLFCELFTQFLVQYFLNIVLYDAGIYLIKGLIHRTLRLTIN